MNYKIPGVFFIVTWYCQVGDSELVRGTWCCHFLCWRCEELKTKCCCTLMPWDMSHKLHKRSLLNMVMWCFSTNHDLQILCSIVFVFVSWSTGCRTVVSIGSYMALKGVTGWLPECKIFERQLSQECLSASRFKMLTLLQGLSILLHLKVSVVCSGVPRGVVWGVQPHSPQNSEVLTKLSRIQNTSIKT
jgi:hypothetical protein